MRTKNNGLWVVALVAAVVFCAAPLLAATAEEPPEVVTVDACQAKKPPVSFTHAAHFEIVEGKCDTCHHTQEGLAKGQDVEVKGCTTEGCHKNPEAAETPDCTEMSTKKNPFHIKCVGCHKDSGKDTAPTKCGDCHKE